MKLKILIGFTVALSVLSIAANMPSALVSPGTVIAFAGATCPVGYLAGDKSSLLRAGRYAALFTAIGTTYGSADGTHFTLPDYRGMFLRGVGTNATQTGQSGSYLSAASLGSTQADTNYAHNHTINISDPGHTHVETADNTFNTWGPSNGPGTATVYALTTGGPQGQMNQTTASHTTGITATSNNTGSSTEARPVNITVTYCIKY